jgi:1-acyl-sn-glycerol-3-phosphate acyltransferase
MQTPNMFDSNWQNSVNITERNLSTGISLMKRETLQKIVILGIKTLTKAEFVGLEHIPLQGGVILATNHMSRIDIPLLFAVPVRPDITALVTDKYQNYPFFKWFTITAGGIWIDRTKADFTAFRLAADAIGQGRALGIAPEGTRSEGELLEGKSGTVLLALKTGVPVIPVGIAGTETCNDAWKHLRRPHIVTRFGAPLNFAPLERASRDVQLQGYTTEIMCQIAALLPEKYHGFYKGHPRIKEILAAGS